MEFFVGTEAKFYVVRDGDGYEVEAPDKEAAIVAQRTLLEDGHPTPLEILPEGKQVFGSYGTIGQKEGPERHLPRRVIR